MVTVATLHLGFFHDQKNVIPDTSSLCISGPYPSLKQSEELGYLREDQNRAAVHPRRVNASSWFGHLFQEPPEAGFRACWCGRALGFF